MMQKNNYKPIKKGSLQYLKGIIRTIILLLRTYKDVVKEKLDQREAQLALYDKFVKIYKQVAIGWLKKGLKNPLLSINEDEE